MKKRFANLFGGRAVAAVIRARALARRHQRFLLNLGIAFVGLCGLALLRQGLMVDGAGEPETAPLFAAYHNNGLIGLLFFGAVASGYAYWCLQFLSGTGPERLRRRHAVASNLAFLLSVGAATIALLLWNAGVFASSQ